MPRPKMAWHQSRMQNFSLSALERNVHVKAGGGIERISSLLGVFRTCSISSIEIKGGRKATLQDGKVLCRRHNSHHSSLFPKTKYPPLLIDANFGDAQGENTSGHRLSPNVYEGEGRPKSAHTEHRMELLTRSPRASRLSIEPGVTSLTWALV